MPSGGGGGHQAAAAGGARRLGDTCNGAELGRSANSTYYWVSCPAQTSDSCLGDRWTTIQFGRYQTGDTRHRICRVCDNDRKRAGFWVSPQRPPTRPM